MDVLDPPLPARIAGRAVVRRIAASPRAETVLLGPHPNGPDPSGPDPRGPVPGGPDAEIADADAENGAALLARIWRADVPREDVDREVAALTRVEHPHVLRIVDLESLPDGRLAALHPRLPGPTVAELLAARTTLGVGEAITLAAPVVAALGALHAAGVAHGRVDAARVRLDGSGAPVLLGFGRARLFARDLPPARRTGDVADDLAGLRTLVTALLDRVDVGVTARETIRVALEVADPELLPALTEALFSVAAPAPVRLVEADAPRSATPSRLPVPEPVRRSRPARRSRPDGRAERSAHRKFATRALRSWEDGTATATAWIAIRRAAHGRWAALGRRTRLALVAAMAATAAVATAIALVPDGGAGADARARPADHPRAVDARVTASPTRRATPSATTDRAESADAAAVRGDDPLAAAAVLLAARETALRAQDAAALPDIDEPGSPVERTDARVAEDGGSAVLPAAPYRLAGSLGQAALVEGAADTHVLLVRTHAGWRIRDVSARDSG